MSLADEVKTKEDIKGARGNLDKILTEATHALAQRTRNLALAATDEGKLWHSGYANIFANPEFANLDTCSSLFSFLEEADKIHELFFGRPDYPSPIDVFFGEELAWPELSPIGIVATHFKAGKRQGVLGVVGPIRLSYATIIPTLRYFSNVIEEITGE